MTSQIESFSQLPLQDTIISYLYKEYSDDEDLQAFVDSYNTITQGYLDWFNQNPLGLYTAPGISGALLDWVGTGVYGIPRPVLSSLTASFTAGIDSMALNSNALNTGVYTSSGTAALATDDIYKRVLTWNTYKGDGYIFNLQWLKNRIARFVNGTGGTDANVLDIPPSISVSGTVFTVTYAASSVYSSMQLAYSNGALSFPFQYTMEFA